MKDARECHEELEWLIGQAIRYLENTDLRGANEALKRANATAATLDDNALPPGPVAPGSSRAEQPSYG